MLTKFRFTMGTILAVAALVTPFRICAQTQEVIYSNRLPVYVGDLINEADASVDAKHAKRLCGRLNLAITPARAMSAGEAAQHSANCIFHIVRFGDLTDPTKVQSAEIQHWYVYSNDHFWSLEDLQQNKRLFGEGHVSFFFIFVNRAFGTTVKNVALTNNVLTIIADNSFAPGQNVSFSATKTATFLNGRHVTILTATSTDFTANFTHADYTAAADSGVVTFKPVGDPTPPPTPGTAPTQIACNLVPALPSTGADQYYASYTIDVKRKVSANVQHLFALLGAEGLKNADQITTAPTPLIASQLLASDTILDPAAFRQLQQCGKPDAIFGGGTIDVAYRPSDISITSSLKSGVGVHEVVVGIDKNPYVVDNEGRYYFDFSVPVTLKNLSAVQYQSTNNSFSPVNTSSLNAFMAIDGFLPASDVKSQNWTRFPHPLAGVGFAKQPLSKILLAGAWGPHFSELYVGVAWIKQPRVAQGSSSCKAAVGSPAATPDSFGTHYCAQFSIGLNLTVTGIANKLGSPK
jgi:hypothetical protein